MLALIARHFGRTVTNLDVSDSGVVDIEWLKTLGAATECPAITSLTAARCSGITDKGIEIFSRKKGPTLRALHVPGCKSVSDDGIEFVAKHCTGLRSLDLSGCPKVRDRSVFAISALTGLQDLALDDCAEVSDNALRQFFTSATQLKSLSIRGCINATEEGLRFMHEMPVPWGIREHRNCALLHTLRLGRNNNISDEFMMVLAVVCPHLRFLEVTECSLVGGDQAMRKIGGLLELEEVTLETLPRVSDQGVREFFCDLPRRALKKLSLAGCTKVTDVSLKCIAKSARSLRELRLDRNVSVTDRGLGYLSKGLAVHLRLLQATHLGMVSDNGVRLLARKCLQLEVIDLSYCLRLTPACLPALRRLRALDTLGLSSCHRLFGSDGARRGSGESTHRERSALDATDFHKLRSLSLAEQPALTDASLRAVTERNSKTLAFLNVSGCCKITAGGVADAVKALGSLKRLDLTGCDQIRTNDLNSFVGYAEPALLLSRAHVEVDGFDGLHCSASAEDARSRQEVLSAERKEELGVRTIQRVFRRYRKREQEENEASLQHSRLTEAALTIQLWVLGYVARQKLATRGMRRARLLLSVFKWRRRTREARSWTLAACHGDRHLLARTVRDWRASCVEEILEASDLAERGEVFFENMVLSTHLRAWKWFVAPLQARRVAAEGRADSCWRARTRESLFRRWRRNVQRAKSRRARWVAEVLLSVLPVEFRNSTRQRSGVESAVTFHRRRALRKAWVAFLSLNKELADLQRRFAMFDKANRPRVLLRNYARLREAVAVQKWKRGAKAKADAVATLSLQRRTFRSLRQGVATAAASRVQRAKAEALAVRKLVMRGWENLREHPAEKKVIRGLLKIWQRRAEAHWSQALKQKGVRQLKDRARRRMQIKVKTVNILSKFMATTVSTCFRAWKLHHRTLKDAARAIKTHENRMLLGRVFVAWAESSTIFSGRAALGQATANAIKEEDDSSASAIATAAISMEASEQPESAAEILVSDDLNVQELQQASEDQQQQQPAENKEAEENRQDGEGGGGGHATETTEPMETAVVVVEYPPEAGVTVVAIQAAWRGFFARKAYEEERVTRQWAAVKVQSFFRARRARRFFAKHMRYKHIRDVVREEAEADAMAIHDRESLGLMLYEQALNTVGRIVLGYKGRKIARERRRQVKLEEAGKRFAEREEALRRHEEAQRRLEILRQDEQRAATMIQATWRGRMAKLRVRGIREENHRKRAATLIQQMVRFRAARHEAAARKRHLARTAYVHLGRQRQALFLRLAGLRNRRSQRPAIRLLRKAGADLMGFTTALRIQRKDLRQGARLAWQEIDMYREAFRTCGRDAYRRRNFIRAHRLDDLERKRIRRGDAVQILNREHEFCGFTGRVLHVDARDPGQEVAEVKIDDGTARVVYVRLLSHEPGSEDIPVVNMLKVDKQEIPQHKPEELALVKDALLAWADRERKWWRPYLAAVAIQRHIRGFLARRSTARRRHRYWTRERALRLTFLDALQVTNAATYQAVRAAVMLRVIKATEVPTNMPWIPPVPPRLEEAVKSRRRRIILEEEMRTRTAERTIMASKNPRKLQWKTPTYGPVVRPYNPYKEAWARLVSKVAHPSALPGVFHSLLGQSYVEELERKAQARTVYTGSFQFAQLEQSPHVRTAGRAFYHGSWGRPDRPKDTSAGESNSSPTSSSSEGSGGPAGRGPESYQEEDWEEEMEDGTSGLDRTAGRDEERVGGTVAGTKKKESKQRFAWGRPRKRGGVEKREKRRKGKNSFGVGDYVDGPGRRNDAAGGFGDGSDNDSDTAGEQTQRKRESKDRVKNRTKEKRKHSKKERRRKKKKIQREKLKSKPHGEGYVEFLDGWGVSQEEKTLYVTVVSAQGLAGNDRSMLIQHCDPFFQLKCNGKVQHTSTKHKTREPKYNETFEFDVSNPASILALECWEEDTFSNNYIGAINIPLRELSDGKKVRNWFTLGTGTFRKAKAFKKEKQRGSVELVLQWLPKETEDDVSIRIRLSKAAVVLQCWARTIVSRREVAEAAEEARVKAEFAFVVTRKIQMCFRRHRAREELRVRKMHYRNACIVQKFARRKLAFMEAAWRRLCRDKATIIQCFIRQHLSRVELARLREERRILERDMATRIQANARGKLARMHVAAKRAAVLTEEGDGAAESPIPVAEWLPLYGTDPYYPSRRIRRITERVYFKILGKAGSTVETRFGTASVLRYPARGCLSERGKDKGSALRDAKRTVEVQWNAHADLHWPRKEREAVFKKAPRCYRGFLDLESAPADRTVARRVVMIQCLARIWIARRRFLWQSRSTHSAIVVQRAYRQYANARVSMLRILQSHTRRHLAKRQGNRLAREKRSVIAVQCAYRSRKARLAAAYKRVIRTVKVRGSSGCSDPLYGPENCVVLDPSDEGTLWSSPYGEVKDQWITFDLGGDYPVGGIRLLAMSNTTAPKLLRVECCKTKKQAKTGDWTLVGSFRADNIAAWQQFDFSRRPDAANITRRWKITFVSNFGNTTAVAANGIQFLLAKEESPRVLTQSHSTIVTPPPVGKDPDTVALSVEGTAWPPHKYQWYRNGLLLEGETLPTLDVRLHTPPTQETRPFRCIHCKHAAHAVPRNAMRVVCGNCETPFVFKEYEETLAARSTWEGIVADLETAVQEADTENEAAIVDLDRARLEASLCEGESKEKFLAAKLILEAKRAAQRGAQERLKIAREALNDKHRELLKTTRHDPIKVRHDFEGLYECRLSNIRGGTIVRTVSTYAIYVFARDPPPLQLKVKALYVPKDKLRRRYWPKYAWAFGWFTHGKIGGDILIKFHDGAVYDGPYVPENCLDLKGSVPPEAREPGHWGTWITKTGWLYEGPLVDNHFDKDCISGVYRLTTPGGEVYEGDLVDEERHGTGEYRYADGTVYSGEWHRGQRQGFGTLISPSGALYEGEFDHNLIHGEGLWSWPDGSSYAGQTKHGVREGKGLYVTEMKDAFFGSFTNNKPHGEVLAHYCDGSKHQGTFHEGTRHGRGTTEEENGNRVIGTWALDKRHGVFELRTPVFIPETQAYEDEIRTGLWEAGEFVEWLSPPVYPHATKQFYEMFENDDSQYDGVYAMLVAKKLPHLPRGVDPTNLRVIACVRRIAAEAGELCASDTIANAQKQVAEAQPPHDAAMSRLQSAQVLERVCLQEHLKKKEAADHLESKLAALVANRDKLEAEVEQFYADDPGKTRELFLDAAKKLKSITGSDWFMVRNYDQPPPVLASLFSAVCTLMLVRDSWKSAKNLVGSSVQNMEEGDEEALAVKYDSKLVYRLENEFSPYTRCDAQDVMLKLATFVVDPRFQGDSLFLKLYGDALGPVAEMVKAAYNYIVKAAEIKPRKMAVAGVEGNITYTTICLEREREEEEELKQQAQEKVAKREAAEMAEAKARAKLDKAKALLEEAKALVTVYVAPREELDPYEQLEMDLDPELTEIEVVLELLGLKVLERLKKVATEVAAFEVEKYISAQAEEKILTAIAEGAYTFAAGAVQCLDDVKIVRFKAGVIDGCKRGINACLRETPSSKAEWRSLEGAKVDESHLEMLLEVKWEDILRAEALKEAINNWKLAFPGEGEAALQALLSVSNGNLSDLRKAEAQLWLDNNPDQTADMRWKLAAQFEQGWPENTAEGCVEVLDSTTYGPDVRLQAASWEKHNPEAVRQHRAENLERLAAEFACMWESEEQAAQEVIAIRERQDAFQRPYAEAWASFHLAGMVTAEEEAARLKSAAFGERYPDGTATQAVRIVTTQGSNSGSGGNAGATTAAAGDAAATTYVGDEDPEAAVRGAQAWIGLHARAATVAEEALAVEIAERDAKAAVEQEALERRLRILEEKKLTEGGGEEGEEEGERGADGGENAPQPPVEEEKALATTDQQDQEKKSKATVGKSKKKNAGVKKSKAQQFAEKQEAERRAKEEEEERLRREAEAAEEALRKKPKSKTEQVNDLLRGKLAERLELCRDLLVLLRRAQEKAEADDSPAKALGDPSIRPSERQGRHDELLAERQKALDSIAARIAQAETKVEEARQKFEAAGGELLAGGGGGNGDGEGWASYLDEQSGQYYWFNDHTGEAYYDEGGAAVE
eukprot:g8702.t2